MSNLSQFLGGGGGGLTPKFQEFNSSGTFTPTQELIDAGGYIEVFLVAGGAAVDNGFVVSGAGGEVFSKQMYLTSTSGVTITIGAGGVSAGQLGNDSVFNGSSAGGINLTARGGGESALNTHRQISSLGAGWGGRGSVGSAGSGSYGYGAGGGSNHTGVILAKANSGQGGSNPNPSGASGYCLIKWYE